HLHPVVPYLLAIGGAWLATQLSRMVFGAYEKLSYDAARRLAFWLIATPLSPLAGRIRLMNLYVPNYTIGLIGGITIGWLSHRPFRIITAFAVAMSALQLYENIRSWNSRYGTSIAMPIGAFITISVSILLFPYLGLLACLLRRPRRPPGYCRS